MLETLKPKIHTNQNRVKIEELIAELTEILSYIRINYSDSTNTYINGTSSRNYE